MRFFGGEKEKPSEEFAPEKEPTEAERFREKLESLMIDKANFFDSKLPFAGFFVGVPNLPDVKLILEEEGYKSDISLEGDHSFIPEDETYVVTPVQGNPDLVMVRVGFKPEHILT